MTKKEKEFLKEELKELREYMELYCHSNYSDVDGFKMNIKNLVLDTIRDITKKFKIELEEE